MVEDLKKIENDLRGLFASQRLAVLATQEKGNPYTNLVAFSSSKNLKELFFATTRSTRKYANIEAHPRAAMLIDNRSNQVNDFRQAMAVTATGKIEEVNKKRAKNILSAYLAKHPHLESFVVSPSCALLRLRVDVYYLVNRFQNVIEVHVKP
jgi:nitroimidazol reductase NimA-like FMN-containing flavoprotein (pyridoxamine 5'-phosphate oxidase superfamily)